MPENIYGDPTWTTARRPIAADRVAVATWADILGSYANNDAYLRAQMYERVPGGPGDCLWQIPLALVADGSLGVTYQAASSATPETMFGHLIQYSGSVEQYARFFARLPRNAYLSAIEVFVCGLGTNPGAGNRPRIQVVHGRALFASGTLTEAASSEFVTNEVAGWGTPYPITYELPEPVTTGNRIVEVWVGAGAATTGALILGVEATLVAPPT